MAKRNVQAEEVHALLSNFNITRVSENRQLLSQSVFQMLLLELG